jgi:hypothetical protein
MKRILLISAAAGGIALVSATTPSCRDEGYITPSVVCSDGPRWPPGSQFEFERNGPTDAPRCTPHCGPNQPPSATWNGAGPRDALTSEALPSGSCSEDGVVCTMAAELLPACPAGTRAVGPLDLFICRCTSGAWGCTIDATGPSATSWSCVMPDGTVFSPGQKPPAPSDAAAEASADAGIDAADASTD